MGKENKSIVQSDSEFCYIHKRYLNVKVPAVHLHHIFHGTANRKLADADGCYCFLCYSCHSALHDKGYHDLDLQKIAEERWLEYYGKTTEDFIKRYGRNYLD